MVHVAQRKFKQLVSHDAGGITEAKKRVICEDGAQTHRSGVENTLMAEIAERRVAMDDLDVLADEYLSQ